MTLFYSKANIAIKAMFALLLLLGAHLTITPHASAMYSSDANLGKTHPETQALTFCTTTPWDASAIYVADDLVSHNGHTWRAKWWTQGEEPGTTGEWGVWEDLGPCDGGNATPTPIPTPTATPTIAPTTVPTATPEPTVAPTNTPVPTATPAGACTAGPWDASAIYVADDLVSHNGHTWRAKWWTQGEEPGTTGEWGVWEDLGPCDGGNATPTPTIAPTTAPTATPTSTAEPTVAPTNTPAPTATPGPAPEHEVVAYFTQWGIYGRQYFVKNIVDDGAADKVTTINYAFGHIYNGECVMVTQTGVMDAYADYQKSFSAAQSVDGVADSWDQPLRGNFNQLKKLKAMYPNLKVLISLGGWTWSEGFSDAALTPESRARAVSSCIDLYLRGNLPMQDGAGGPGAAAGVFDGIDIDWEYPANPANDGHVYRPEDTQNFTLLLQEFRRQLDNLEQETGRSYLLTIAAPAGVDKYEKIELDKIHPYLDWINLMTYDMHGAWESVTNHQAPIYHAPDDPSPYPASEYSIDQTVSGYLAADIPPQKLLIGIPFYGRGWKGVPDIDHGRFQTASGAAPGAWEAGIEDYKVLKTRGYASYRDDVAKAVWLYNGNEFWSYDDPAIIAEKMAYLKARGLRGAMAWSLDGDDGALLTAIHDGLQP